MSQDPHFARRLGKGMIAVGFVAALGVLTVLFQRQLDHQRNPNTRPRSRAMGLTTEVVLEANRQNHYVATAVINGVDVEVLVDTGATQIAVSENLARRLGLEVGPAFNVSTASGTAVAYATALDEVQLGDIVKRNLRASIVPGMQAPEVLLGMNFLRDLEITQRNGRLILRDSAE